MRAVLRVRGGEGLSGGVPSCGDTRVDAGECVRMGSAGEAHGNMTILTRGSGKFMRSAMASEVNFYNIK
jgi:hypothetical protein